MSPDKLQQLEYTLTQLGEHYRSAAVLTDAEKQSLHAHITKSISEPQLSALRPLPHFKNHSLVSPFASLSQFSRMGMRIGAIAVVIVSVLGTGLVAVSADSLPGEKLYPTKIAFENLRSELTPNSESQLAYDLSRTAQRFEELQKLNETGALTPETATLVIQHIEEHTESATQASHALAFAQPRNHKKAFTPLKDTLIKEVEDLTQSIETSSLSTNALVESTLVEITRIATETIEEAEKIEITLDEVLDEAPITEETSPVETSSDSPIMTSPTTPDVTVIDERIDTLTIEVAPLFSGFPVVEITEPALPIETTVSLPTPVTANPVIEQTLPPSFPVEAPMVIETKADIFAEEKPEIVRTTSTTSVMTIEETLPAQETMMVSPVSSSVAATPVEEIPVQAPVITTFTTPSVRKEVSQSNRMLIEDLKRDYSLLLSAREEKNLEASLKLIEKIEALLKTLPRN